MELGFDRFTAGAIVCGVGYPRNIGAQIGGRADVQVFDGGLVQLPKRLSFRAGTSTPDPEVLLRGLPVLRSLDLRSHGRR
jgi:predicted amino acid dehydrogenase